MLNKGKDMKLNIIKIFIKEDSVKIFIMGLASWAYHKENLFTKDNLNKDYFMGKEEYNVLMESSKAHFIMENLMDKGNGLNKMEISTLGNF